MLRFPDIFAAADQKIAARDCLYFSRLAQIPASLCEQKGVLSSPGCSLFRYNDNNSTDSHLFVLRGNKAYRVMHNFLTSNDGDGDGQQNFVPNGDSQQNFEIHMDKNQHNSQVNETLHLHNFGNSKENLHNSQVNNENFYSFKNYEIPYSGNESSTVFMALVHPREGAIECEGNNLQQHVVTVLVTREGGYRYWYRDNVITGDLTLVNNKITLVTQTQDTVFLATETNQLFTISFNKNCEFQMETTMLSLDDPTRVSIWDWIWKHEPKKLIAMKCHNNALFILTEDSLLKVSMKTLTLERRYVLIEQNSKLMVHLLDFQLVDEKCFILSASYPIVQLDNDVLPTVSYQLWICSLNCDNETDNEQDNSFICVSDLCIKYEPDYVKHEAWKLFDNVKILSIHEDQFLIGFLNTDILVHGYTTLQTHMQRTIQLPGLIGGYLRTYSGNTQVVVVSVKEGVLALVLDSIIGTETVVAIHNMYDNGNKDVADLLYGQCVAIHASLEERTKKIADLLYRQFCHYEKKKTNQLCHPFISNVDDSTIIQISYRIIDEPDEYSWSFQGNDNENVDNVGQTEHNNDFTQLSFNREYILKRLQHKAKRHDRFMLFLKEMGLLHSHEQQRQLIRQLCVHGEQVTAIVAMFSLGDDKWMNSSQLNCLYRAIRLCTRTDDCNFHSVSQIKSLFKALAVLREIAVDEIRFEEMCQQVRANVQRAVNCYRCANHSTLYQTVFMNGEQLYIVSPWEQECFLLLSTHVENDVCADNVDATAPQ